MDSTTLTMTQQRSSVITNPPTKTYPHAHIHRLQQPLLSINVYRCHITLQKAKADYPRDCVTSWQPIGAPALTLLPHLRAHTGYSVHERGEANMRMKARRPVLRQLPFLTQWPSKDKLPSKEEKFLSNKIISARIQQKLKRSKSSTILGRRWTRGKLHGGIGTFLTGKKTKRRWMREEIWCIVKKETRIII